MAIQPFSWGANGEKASPSRVKKYADIAAALAAKGGAPSNLGEGLNRVGEALLANSYNSKAAAGEQEGAASRKAMMDALLTLEDPTMADITGAMGNEWVTSDPGSSAVLQALMGAEIQQNDPLRQQQLQMGEIELANAQKPAAPEYGFEFAPDGTMIRTDKTSGSFEEMGEFAKPDPGFTLVAPEEAIALGLPKGSYQKGPDGKIYEIGGGGTTINNMGNIPAGYELFTDPETGASRMQPIAGSPAAVEAAAASDAAALSDERADLKGGVVVEDIDRALQSIMNNPMMTTGIGSAISGSIPATPAYNVNALIDTVKANAGFAELQAMRESSPTGGALGNVTEKEISYLQSTIGNLDPRQSPEQLADNLKRVKNAYLDVIHGAGNGPPREPLSFESQGADKPQLDYNAPEAPEGWGGDPELWRFMTPEDRALW